MVGFNLTILDQIAKIFLLLSEAPSYWFTLNTSCDHAFHLSKWLGMDESDYKALAIALPPPPPPSRRSLVGCCVVTTVRFRHRMPSCNHQHSHCRPLSPINCLPPPPPPPLPLPPPPQPPRCCHRAPTVALSDTEKSAADVVLWRCRHRRSCRAAATALPPLCCVPLPRCRQPRAVVLPPPPPLSRRRSLVGCCVVVHSPISSSHAVM